MPPSTHHHPQVPYRVIIEDSWLVRQRQSRLLAALEANTVPSAFLYTSFAQAARWLAYHETWSPASQPEVQDVYNRAFARLSTAPSHWVSLGSGGGAKEARALEHLDHKIGAYVAVDVSPALVAESMARVAAAAPTTRTEGVIADLEVPVLRPQLIPEASESILWLAFGLLPNAHEPFLAQLRTLLKAGDRLLLSANLSPHPYPEGAQEILAQYDNPESRAWLGGALLELGLNPQGVELSFRTESLRPDGQAWRIRAIARLEDAQDVLVPGAQLRWPGGTRLSVFHSDRYTVSGAEAHLRQAGFHIAAEHVSSEGDEGVFELRT